MSSTPVIKSFILPNGDRVLSVNKIAFNKAITAAMRSKPPQRPETQKQTTRVVAAR